MPPGGTRSLSSMPNLNLGHRNIFWQGVFLLGLLPQGKTPSSKVVHLCYLTIIMPPGGTRSTSKIPRLNMCRHNMSWVKAQLHWELMGATQEQRRYLSGPTLHHPKECRRWDKATLATKALNLGTQQEAYKVTIIKMLT